MGTKDIIRIGISARRVSAPTVWRASATTGWRSMRPFQMTSRH